MSYDIFSPIAPKMPKLGKGTHTLTLALSQTSAEMREPIAAMIIPVMASLITGVKFKYSDNNFYETCGQMGHLIGPSGIGKAQFTRLVEAVMRSFRQHDETEFQKLVDWQRQMKTKGANKEKPERPDVAFWYPPADMTNTPSCKTPWRWRSWADGRSLSTCPKWRWPTACSEATGR